ncbi:MAG: FAD-dependent oxidoreductase [Psychroflexus halocasei]
MQKNFRVNYQKDDIEESIKAEMVFNTAGRVPSINHLNLEKGNVSFTRKGVTVNKYLQNPGNKNVYACGDVSASEGLPLTPLSSIEAKIVITHILDKNIKEKAKYPAQPSVVFTTPQLASIGLSVEEAERRNFDINVKENFGLNWFNAKRINERTYGFQTIIDKKSGQILGAHIIASEAAEMINLFAMAMQTQLTYKEVKALIFSYPTWGNDIKQMI